MGVIESKLYLCTLHNESGIIAFDFVQYATMQRPVDVFGGCMIISIVIMHNAIVTPYKPF